MNIDVTSKLFPNLTTLIIQLCSTGVLYLVFRKFLWVPVQNFFAKRADFIEGQINEAKEMNEKAKALMEESDQQARESAVEYREIVNRAKDDAQATKNKIIDDAKLEAQAKIAQADREIEAMKAKAHDEMKEEMVSVAIEVASKVMSKEMDSEENKRMVEDFVEKVVN